MAIWPEMSQCRRDRSAAPCLTCGYDLRAAMKPGAGELRCPECGQVSPSHSLLAYGLHRAASIQLISLMLAPSILLVISSWGFAIWSGNAVHVGFCLMFSPFAIAAHVYALHEFIEQGIVLTKSRKRWVKIVSIAAALMLDIAACVLMARWLM